MEYSTAKFEIELFTERVAKDFRETYINDTTFIGAGIETILNLKNISIVYKVINDGIEESDRVYGGLVTLPNSKQYVIVNTKYNTRIQYFTLAHELWHVIENQSYEIYDYRPGEAVEELSERAGDHFAATLMLNEHVVKSIYSQSIKNNMTLLDTIYYIADMSIMPYVSVRRRIDELIKIEDESPQIKKEFKFLSTWIEEDFIYKRTEILGYAHTYDAPKMFNYFQEYRNILNELVKSGEITEENASIKISPFENNVS
ncbi:hypothetical protein JFL43_03700 [Viridibacillus sp. YIM B01967]|uniref:IrrE N-terminal-like domain-containing protein n=1 Tax=Viridibacillus soli TaxID=2798301 RepID=A0ABS1H3J5_9BACL|nr:hypothetical protein [Viridibacillus soli]MBK3493976.1 hypothetical protein [Viridibacillus soli]